MFYHIRFRQVLALLPRRAVLCRPPRTQAHPACRPGACIATSFTLHHHYDTALQLALSYPVLWLVGHVAPSLHEYWWRGVLWSIQLSGPTFVKFFQWASTRQDLFPKSFCVRFATLQSNARMHSWSDTKKLMQASFGASSVMIQPSTHSAIVTGSEWEQHIKLEADSVIGSGCIAQACVV